MDEKRKENQYRYNDIEERYQKMNRAFIMVASCLWVLFMVYLLFKLGSKSIAAPTAYGNMVIVVLFAAANVVVYFRNKKGARLKEIVALEMGIEILLLGMQTDAEFIYYAILGMIALQIPYYDKKYYKRSCIFYAVLFTLLIALRFAKGIIWVDVDVLCRIICMYLMFFLLYQVGSIAKLFSDHALGSVEQQSGEQKVMLDDILDTCMVVQGETQKSSNLVDELVTATEAVAQSMREITAATNTTAQSIEEQNNMTQSIQTAIGETGERSKRMVEIATDSNESIQENMQVMEQLKNQSQQIAATNQKVTESMIRLQDKTREVEEIAGMILNISSQTNLLALNASIESARAGEAGRGFAVVAEQIRQLAEQTRSSTEEITRIINELNENADEVVKSVESSVEATESQNDKIIMAVESFEKLNTNMTELLEDISAIDRQILELSDSNNHIVENISQLSAATEEVTASAEQVREMSEQNMICAEDVKGAIGMIQGRTDSMKHYV